MSGLLLRVMIVFVPSRKNCVAHRGRSPSLSSTSTTSKSLTSTCSFSNRLAGLQEAPLPWIDSRLWGTSSITGTNLRLAMIHIHLNISTCPAGVLPKGRFIRPSPWAKGDGLRQLVLRFAMLIERRYNRAQSLWRGGRAVDRAGLENRRAERPREFESHPLRRNQFSIADCGWRIGRRKKWTTSSADRIPSIAAQTTSDK